MRFISIPDSAMPRTVADTLFDASVEHAAVTSTSKLRSLGHLGLAIATFGLAVGASIVESVIDDLLPPGLGFYTLANYGGFHRQGLEVLVRLTPEETFAERAVAAWNDAAGFEGHYLAEGAVVAQMHDRVPRRCGRFVAVERS